MTANSAESKKEALEMPHPQDDESMTDNTPVTKSDLQTAIQAAVKELKEYIDERTHDAETRLLRAFSDYNNSAGVRFRKMEADIALEGRPSA